MARGSWGGQRRLDRLTRTRGIEEAIKLTTKPTTSEALKKVHKKRVREGTHRRIDVGPSKMVFRDGKEGVRGAYWYSIPMRNKVERTDEEKDKLTEDVTKGAFDNDTKQTPQEG